MTKPHHTPKETPKVEPEGETTFMTAVHATRGHYRRNKVWWNVGVVGSILTAIALYVVNAWLDSLKASYNEHENQYRTVKWRIVPQVNNLQSNVVPDILIRLQRLEKFTNDLNNPAGSFGEQPDETILISQKAR